MATFQAMSQLASKVNAVASGATAGAVIRQATDAATIMFSLRPATYNTQEGTDPLIGGWNFSIGEPTDFTGSGTRKDRILGVGYNISKYGGGTPTPQEITTDASFGWTIEDFYNLSATSLRQFEFYVQSCPAGDDGTGQVRPFMITTQYQTLASTTAPLSGMYFDLDETQGLTITMSHADAGTLTSGETTTSGVITVTGAHDIYTKQYRDVTWATGSRTNVLIGAVSANTAGSTVAFSGGTGDNLPANTTAISFKTRDITLFSSAAAGQDVSLFFPGGTGISFGNNQRGLKAQNSSGTFRDLMYWRSDDYIMIGDLGQEVIQLSGSVVTYGVTTVYVTGGATMTDTLYKAVSGTNTTPIDGALGVIENGGARKIAIRAGGAWYHATCT